MKTFLLLGPHFHLIHILFPGLNDGLLLLILELM